jgi:DUF2934 family protein
MPSPASKKQAGKSAEMEQNVPASAMDRELVNADEIAIRAYELWQERGCPIGSPEIDWLRAEDDLRNRARTIQTAA